MHSAKSGMRLNIQSGFECGYNSPLAIANDEINLDAGTHYLLGRNGKGKTTLLRTISRLIPTYSGSFTKSSNTVFIPEDLSFDAELTPKAIFKALLPKGSIEDALTFAKEIELDVKKLYGKLSTGNKRKVLLVLSEFQLHGEEEGLVMMDEPLSGLDQEVRAIVEKRWNESKDKFTRLISYHPDNERASIQSALVISGGELKHVKGESLNWGELKQLVD